MTDANADVAAPEAKPIPPGFNPWRVRIFLLIMAHMMATGNYMAVMAMGPVIRTDLGITAAEFGFFMSAVFGAQLVMALPSGAITDRMGVGWTLFGASLVSTAGSVLCALSHTFDQALASAFLMGLGYSFVNPATAKAVMRWFPAEWRGTAMGLKQLGVPLGGVLAAGGGVLAAYIDWHHVLWITSSLSFVAAILWLPLTRRPTAGEGGLLGVFRDLKAVMGNTNLRTVSFACLSFNSTQASLFAYTSLFLRDAAMASQPIAATGVAFVQAASAMGRVGYSYLSDTTFGGRRTKVVLGIALAAFGACCIAALVNPSWPHWGLLILSVVMGGTIASYAGLVLVMSGESVPPRLVGTAIGFNAVSWSLGGMIGPPLFGLVLDLSGNDYGLAWVIIGMGMLIGAGPLWLWHKDPARSAR